MSEIIKSQSRPRIPRRVLGALITSLKSGVVPRSGAPYIAIGRAREIDALVGDMKTVSEGGSAMRFIIGRYGSGKSFLMQLMRGYAAEQGFVCMDADLSPERRLYGSGGSGLATYRELIKNMSSKSSPDGNALRSVVERQLSMARHAAASEGIDVCDPSYAERVGQIVRGQLRELCLSVGGFDFCEVLTRYLYSVMNGDDETCSACLRWLRGEYSTKSEAKRTLGFSVSCIADDDNWYDFIKLWAVYCRICGYKGLVVMLDECVNLYKITNRVSRENNYEKLLSMFNDTLSARAEGLMMLLCGTPQFLEDTRRGLFGYEALRSRLCDSRYATPEYTSVSGPLIRLRRLSDDEMAALILRVKNLHAQYYGTSPELSMEDMARFYNEQKKRAVSDDMITPREMIRDFLFVLDIMTEDPSITLDRVIGDAHGEDKEDATRKRAAVTPEEIEL